MLAAAKAKGSKKCVFDPKVNIMKYKAPETAPFKDKIAWEDKVSETFNEVKKFKLGGAPLHKFIHTKVRALESMRHSLFSNACGNKDEIELPEEDDDDDDDDDDKAAKKKKKK